MPTVEVYYSFTENCYIYQYKDHLGNERLSFARSSTRAQDLKHSNNYYLLVINHLSANGSAFLVRGSYKNYKYNGKELQETGMYDH